MIRVSTFAKKFKCTKREQDNDYPYTLTLEEEDYRGEITLYLSQAALASLRDVIANPLSEEEVEVQAVVESGEGFAQALEPEPDAGTSREVTLTADDESDMPF